MWKLDVFGVLVHCLLLLSIFDVYKESVYTSELIYQNEARADRTILFIVSGLRPDMVYSAVEELHSKLPLWHRFKVRGIMKAEVPTTSTNGLLAFSTGINEGLLSVVPINRDLDTIFDRANGSTLYFGQAIDTVYYFQKNLWNLIKYNIDLNSNKFNENDEIFAKIQVSLNEIEQNKIVLIHLKAIIESSKSYECLYKCVDIVVRLFDEIQGISDLIEKEVNGTSVYLLLADHGMTTSGSYGGNSVEETDTFYSIWGNGVAENNITLGQIQVANIISTILGDELPRNSLAITPVAVFNGTDEVLASYVAQNALHLASIAKKSVAQIELIVKLLNYMHVEPFKHYSVMLEHERTIKKMLKSGRADSARTISEQLIELSLTGTASMKKYMGIMIQVSIHTMYIGWLLLLLLKVIDRYSKNVLRNKEVIDVKPEKKEEEQEDGVVDVKVKEQKSLNWCLTLNSFFILIAVLALIFVISHSWPLHYFFYWLLPTIIWHDALSTLTKLKKFTKLITLKSVPKLALYLALLSLCSELLYWGLVYKMLLIVPLLSVTIYLTVCCMMTSSSTVLLLTVCTSGLTLCLTVLLTTIKQTNINLLNISAFIWILTGLIATYRMRFIFLDYLITLFSLLHYICSFLLVNVTAITEPQVKDYIVACFQLASALFIPVFGSTIKHHRFLQIAICIASIFLLFSISYESIILFILFTNIVCWFLLEHEYENKQIPLNTNIDLPLIYLMLVVSSYSILGNTDDLNFTNVQFTKRFFTQVNPLNEFILLIIKHCLVLLLIQTLFTMILRKRGDDILFTVAILVLNCFGYRSMIMLLFWPDNNAISKQLTTHCILQITSAFLLLSYSWAKLYTSVSIVTLFNKCANLKKIVPKFVKKKE